MKIRKLGSALKQRAEAANHRSGVVLAGHSRWGKEVVNDFLGCYDPHRVLWVSTDAPENCNTVPSSGVSRFLGSEFDAVVFDAHSGFDPDALGSIAGTIRGGGMLVILAPALSGWPGLNDPEYRRIGINQDQCRPPAGHYLHRLVTIIQNSKDIVVVEEGKQPALPAAEKPWLQSRFIDPIFRSADQKQAVEALVHVITGQRKRPVVLLSDRGRGKSAALGIAAGMLLSQGVGSIIVTGHHRRSVEQVFAHARDQHDGVDQSLCFMAVDRILKDAPETDFLLVDEAAAIPLHLLRSLLKKYPRIAFATTVHGYEGTGRGFMLRFTEILDNHTRGWKTQILNTPVRWAEGDPLERFLFDLLLLNAEPAAVNASALELEHCKIESVTQSRLASDSELLHNLFGLLVMAHYRTRPYDVRHLLDSPDLTIYRIMHDGDSVGVVLVSHEGELASDRAASIWAGKSRPRGHLLPQILAAHLGLRKAAELKCTRIMRIVVHPEFQGRGVGSFALQWLERQYHGKSDLLGASFGVSPELLRFWSRAGYQPVRIGLSRSQYSGTLPCLVVTGISRQGIGITERAATHFHQNFWLQLKTVFQQLDPAVVEMAYQSNASRGVPQQIDDHALLELVQLGFGQRNPDTMPATLNRFAEICLAGQSPVMLNGTQRSLLVERVLQGKNWENCHALAPHQGRADGLAALRSMVREVVKKMLPGRVKKMLIESGLDTDKP